MKYIQFIVAFVLILLGAKTAFAESIDITQSDVMNKVIFDGKWTYFYEWKRSSFTDLSYNDGTRIELRTAHQNNFIYVFIDNLSDTSIDKGADSATICFDTKDNKNLKPDSNDYCFVAILNGSNSFVLQGGSPLGINSNFKKIDNPPGFIGISSVSDANDRYTDVPHTSYEFRIPTDLVGRSDMYGFYVGVYDSHSNKMYSWPQGITVDSLLKIPSPNKWGDLVSPDKSLPEFQWPILALVSSLAIIIYMTRRSVVFHR
ncbi:MAG: hypothetical protein ACYC6W_00020 [Nitrosotalea sp.]